MLCCCNTVCAIADWPSKTSTEIAEMRVSAKFNPVLGVHSRPLEFTRIRPRHTNSGFVVKMRIYA